MSRDSSNTLITRLRRKTVAGKPVFPSPIELEAADRIEKLEAALHAIADFSEQFIADDEDGDERMYKVNQIADTALAHAASGATTAANRGGEP